MPLVVGEVPAAGEVVVVVVVAGDIPGTDAVAIGLAPGAVVTGATVVPGAAAAGDNAVAGEVTGAVTGAVAAGLTGAVAGLFVVVGGDDTGLAGDVWPNDVSARVIVQRLAISSVFIGLSLDCPDRVFR